MVRTLCSLFSARMTSRLLTQPDSSCCSTSTFLFATAFARIARSTSTRRAPRRSARFIDALALEARHRLATARCRRARSTSAAAPRACSRHATSRACFAALHEMIDFPQLDEVTLEANPATFDLAKARLLRDARGDAGFAGHPIVQPAGVRNPRPRAHRRTSGGIRGHPARRPASRR